MIINTATTALHEQIWWGMEKKKALVDLPDVTISIKGSWKTIESAKSVNKYKNCFELRRKIIAVMKSGYSCGNERSPVLDKISSHKLCYNDAELPVTRSQALTLNGALFGATLKSASHQVPNSSLRAIQQKSLRQS